MYNLIEYSDNYSKTSGILWQYRRDVRAVNNSDVIIDFTEANATTDSFVLKQKLTDQTCSNGTENVEIMVPLIYLSNFGRTLEMPLVIYEIIFDLNQSENCVIVATNVTAQATTYSKTDANRYAPVVVLSTQNHAKLLKQLKSGFKKTIK